MDEWGKREHVLLSCAKIKMCECVLCLKLFEMVPHTSMVLKKQILDMLTHTQSMLFITKLSMNFMDD